MLIKALLSPKNDQFKERMYRIAKSEVHLRRSHSIKYPIVHFCWFKDASHHPAYISYSAIGHICIKTTPKPENTNNNPYKETSKSLVTKRVLNHGLFQNNPDDNLKMDI